MAMIFRQTAQFPRHILGGDLQGGVETFAFHQFAEGAGAGDRVQASIWNQPDVDDVLIPDEKFDFDGVSAGADPPGATAAPTQASYVHGTSGVSVETVVQRAGAFLFIGLGQRQHPVVHGDYPMFWGWAG